MWFLLTLDDWSVLCSLQPSRGAQERPGQGGADPRGAQVHVRGQEQEDCPDGTRQEVPPLAQGTRQGSRSRGARGCGHRVIPEELVTQCLPEYCSELSVGMGACVATLTLSAFCAAPFVFSSIMRFSIWQHDLSLLIDCIVFFPQFDSTT